MAKRKRDDADEPAQATNGKFKRHNDPLIYVQIVTGSYERALHGISASIPRELFETGADFGASDSADAVAFADTFLFNAHASSIRCLAISPPSAAPGSSAQKVVLATGSADERIHLYHLSTSPPPVPAKGAAPLPTLTGTKISQNPRNRELGSLLHHAGAVSALHFPSRSKLLSAASDNTIAVSRTRDWTVLSTIKAPIPKPVGRPSGDTLAPGEVPAGVNDFAVHPSGKLLVSVGRGEKCMRLWNLMTGKKAGVLSFDKALLAQVGEGRHGTGEGRRVVWDAPGEEFTVAFDRAAVVFGMDCKPLGNIMPTPRTKVHQMQYLPGEDANVLCVSTEDGRILFYSTSQTADATADEQDELASFGKDMAGSKTIPSCKLLASIGGLAAGLASRIKDFTILDPLPTSGKLVCMTACSDGAVRVWLLDTSRIRQGDLTPKETSNGDDVQEPTSTDVQPMQDVAVEAVARTVGVYETGHRITCLKAFELNGILDEPEEQGTNAAEAESSGDDSEDPEEAE